MNNLHDEKKVSLHKAIACKAKRVIHFYLNAMDADQIDQMLMLRDGRGFSCIDYARLGGDQDIIKLITETNIKRRTLEPQGIKIPDINLFD